MLLGVLAKRTDTPCRQLVRYGIYLAVLATQPTVISSKVERSPEVSMPRLGVIALNGAQIRRGISPLATLGRDDVLGVVKAPGLGKSENPPKVAW